MPRVSFVFLCSILFPFSLIFPSALANDTPIRVGVNELAPYHLVGTPSRPGLYDETLQTLMNAVGLEAEYHVIHPRRIIESFNEGVIDVTLMSHFISEINANFVNLGLIYTNANHSLAIRRDPKQHYKDFLRNKTVIVPNAHAARNMAEYLPNMTFVQVQDYSIAIRMLLNNRADAVLGLEPTLRYFSLKSAPNEDIHFAVVKSSSIHLYRNSQSSRDSEIWDQLDAARADLYDQGIFYNISERYIPGWQDSRIILRNTAL